MAIIFNPKTDCGYDGDDQVPRLPQSPRRAGRPSERQLLHPVHPQIEIQNVPIGRAQNGQPIVGYQLYN